jgi:hypothetical protein
MTQTEEILDRHMPIKKITNKEFKQKHKPWVSLGLITSMKRKDWLFKKYVRAKNPVLIYKANCSQRI